MSYKYNTYRLDEVCEFQNGFAFKNSDYVANDIGAVEVFRMGYIERGGGFKEDSTPVFVPKSYKKNMDRYSLEKGDLCIAMTDMKNNMALLANTARVPVSGRFWLNQRVGRIRVVREDILDPLYLYYYSNSKPHIEYLRSRANSGVQVNLTTAAIKEAVLKLPSLDTQKKVAKILGELDEKIAVNTQTNQTLEQIAQALFKSWFVDFDPVKAKIETLATGGSADDAELAAMSVISAKTLDELKSLKASNPEAFNKLAQTAALFPDAMQDSELGEIPEGWDNGKIGDVVQFSSKRADVSGLNLKNYISTENMLENKRGITTASSLPSVNSVPAFDENEILISNIRPYFKKIWLAEFKGGRSPDVLGFSLLDPEETEFAYNLLYQDRFFEYMMTTSKGAKMPRGDKSAIKQFSFPLPQKELRLVFSKHVSLFYPMIRNTNRESEHLHALRDALLPELLSGNLGRA